MLTVPYSFVESAVCLGKSVVYFLVDIAVWFGGTPQVSELGNYFQFSSTNGDVGRAVLTVSSKCRPLVVVNVAGTEGLLEGVFKMFLWSTSVTVASGEFIIEGWHLLLTVRPGAASSTMSSPPLRTPTGLTSEGNATRRRPREPQQPY